MDEKEVEVEKEVKTLPQDIEIIDKQESEADFQIIDKNPKKVQISPEAIEEQAEIDGY